MKWYGILCLFALPLAPASGQENPATRAGIYDAPQVAAYEPRTMYEDIEIMRRLISRSLVARPPAVNHWKQSQCASCHATSHSLLNDPSKEYMANHPARNSYYPQQSGAVFADYDIDGSLDIFVVNDSDPHSAAIPMSIEGVYLKGRGIVYSLNLPTMAREELAITNPGQPAAGRASDWDIVRSQLRGTPAKAPTPPKKATFVDSLLQVLAENGKNLSQLPAKETVTVVVTFRGNSTIDVFHNSMGYSSTRSETAASSNGSPQAGGPAAGPKTAAEPITPDRELELLAELHLKRGNLDEAASALERAVARAKDITVDPTLPAQQIKAIEERANNRIRDLVRKLAEIYLKNNRLDAAKNALAVNPVVTVAASQPKPAATTAPESVRLPAKLILTVSKETLNSVGRGIITPEQFHNQVILELLNMDPPPRPSEPKK
jgi:hypothetical protein